MNKSQSYKDLVDARLRNLSLPKEPKDLYQPISYFLGLGGKRMRPVITLLCQNLYSSPDSSDVEVACGVELFHNFTLLHDDIMDEAPLRRGSPTVHSKWNSNIGILAGDALMIKAYEFFVKDKPAFSAVLDRFNKVALEVCEGQQMDMDFEKTSDLSTEVYMEMIRLKTATLIGFSAWLGGTLGEADPSDLELLNDLGNEVGLGFQLMDDYLDAFGDPNAFGKKVGGDIFSGKKTILWIAAREAGSIDQKEKIDTIFGLPERSDVHVKEIISLYKGLQIDQLVKAKIKDNFSSVSDKILSLGGNKEAKNELISYLDSLGKRDF